MATVYFQVVGVLSFLVATLVLGARIRRSPTEAAAHRLSRVSHGFFWGALVVPELVGLFVPGLARLDGLVGLPPLPEHVVRVAAGWVAVLLGAWFVTASSLALKTKGSGYAAFRLTRRVVSASVYERVRNPMSLGWYLGLVGASLVSGSTFALGGTCLVYIPVHAFNLVYFEEVELRARYGASYEAYLRRVPFLLPRLHLGPTTD